jgi:hypothetical protein
MTDISVVTVTGATWGEYTLSGSGVGGVRTRYCSADIAASANIGTSYPVEIPSAGYNYSYWKTDFLKFASWDDTRVYNIRYYGDGTQFDGETGLTVWIGISSATANNGMPSSNYTQATGTQGSTGDPFWLKGGFYYSSIRGNGNTCSGNLNSYTSDSPLWVQSGNTNDIEGNGYSWGVVHQVQVGSTATNGIKSPETRTWKYNII